MNSLLFSRNHFWIAIYIVNLLYMKNHSRGFGLNQLFFHELFLNSISISRTQFELTFNPLSFSRNHDEFTILYTSLSLFTILYTVNTLPASRFYYVFIICSANSPWIHYLFRKFTMNTISVSKIHNLFREWTKNSLWFHYLLWIHFLYLEFTILFSESRWIYYPFHFITVKTLSISRFHYEYTIFFAGVYILGI